MISICWIAIAFFIKQASMSFSLLLMITREEATIEKSYWIHSIQSATIEEYYQYLLNRQDYATAYTHATKYHLPLDD